MTTQEKLLKLHTMMIENESIIYSPETNPAHLDIFIKLQEDLADTIIEIKEAE